MGAIQLGARVRAKKPVLPHFRVMEQRGIWWHGFLIPHGEVLVAREGGDVKRWLRMRFIERIELRGPAPIPGICQVCGCTWAKACAGGCKWANRKRTLCSACA